MSKISQKDFLLFNKSCKDMSELFDSSIDLIYFSPPYNLGEKYNKYKDKRTFSKYVKLLESVFLECERVLKSNGKVIFEVAETVFVDGKFVALGALCQNICLKNKLYLETRHINYALTKNYVEQQDHGWNKDFYTRKNAHSNCQQILVFSKKKIKFKNGKINYFNYNFTKDHSCPFPKEEIKFVLDNYFKKGFNVLDPFMGTAMLGKEVMERKGKFIGYEI